MPTFLDQHRLAPKSVLRHRPLRADVETDEGVSIPRHSPSHHRGSPSRAGASQATIRRTWVPVLLGMLAAILLVYVGNIVTHWTATALDDLHYGRPRTYQTDAVVGHHDSAASPSHFLALNLHGRIEILEWPGGDATHAHVYVGPQLLADGGELVPVTLSFTDPGRGPVDMVVHVASTTLLFHNNGQTFVPPTESLADTQLAQSSLHTAPRGLPVTALWSAKPRQELLTATYRMPCQKILPLLRPCI